MIRSLVAASMLWPLLMAATVEARIDGHGAAWTPVVYAVGSYICHQKPDRSFYTDGVRWPVCARCSGLYASAPIGAMLAAGLAIRRRRLGRGDWRPWRGPIVFLGLAAIPSLFTLVIEKSGMAAPSGIARFVAALPLGAAVAAVVIFAVAGNRRTIM
jgi:uncharacterized membrane protein